MDAFILTPFLDDCFSSTTSASRSPAARLSLPGPSSPSYSMLNSSAYSSSAYLASTSSRKLSTLRETASGLFTPGSSSPSSSWSAGTMDWQGRVVKKGAWVLKGGKKHHSMGDEAIWSSDFETETLDNEAMCYTASRDTSLACNGLTKYPWKEGEEPARVLELGCGSGSWTLEMASIWKTSTFTGMGLASIQPTPSSLPDQSLAKRITWVKGNFLRPLPFADGSFDFVSLRMQGGGMLVLESSWDSLFEEVNRVLSPQRVFELDIQDSLFPGFKSPRQPQSSHLPLSTTSIPISTRLSTLPSSILPLSPPPPPPLEFEPLWRDMLQISGVNGNCTCLSVSHPPLLVASHTLPLVTLRAPAIAPASLILHFQATVISPTIYSSPPLPYSLLSSPTPPAERDLTLSHTALSSVLAHRETLLSFLPARSVSEETVRELFCPYEQEEARYREWVLRELGWEERGGWVAEDHHAAKKKMKRGEKEELEMKGGGKTGERGTRVCWGVSSRERR